MEFSRRLQMRPPTTSVEGVTDCATYIEQPIATDSLLSPALIAARQSQKRKRTSHLEEGGSPSMTPVRAAPRALQAVEDEATSSPVGAGSPESQSSASAREPSTGSTSQDSPTALERDISREAFMQAEDTIVADSDEGATLVGDGTDDGGYDSDSGVSSSTSIASSVMDYLFENGRRYHRYREGIYDFPNDETEQGREDMKHATLKLLCNQKAALRADRESPAGDPRPGYGDRHMGHRKVLRDPLFLRQQGAWCRLTEHSGREVPECARTGPRPLTHPAGLGAAQRALPSRRYRVAVASPPKSL